MKSLPHPLQGVLFDLDGTLIDSAPGLYAALKDYASERRVLPPPFETVREVVSKGARAVLKTVWPAANDDRISGHIQRYLELYAPYIKRMSPPFAGAEALLDELDAAGLPWGIVTNKAGRLARPLLEHLGWWQRSAAFVAGDTLKVSKPDPATVLDACRQAGIHPAFSLFVGDDRRDMQAGNGAGLYTIAANWGYLNNDDPGTWQADCIVDTPTQLHQLIQTAIR